MSDYQTRNYTAHGGKETVIGGKLTFLPGAEVEGLEALLPSMQPPQLPAQPTAWPRPSPRSRTISTRCCPNCAPLA